MVVNQIEILAGQRYSVVLEANQPVANYWINAPFVGGTPSRNLNQNATLSRAILRYAGAPAADPPGPMGLGPLNPNALLEANLRPLVADTPPAPDVNITLNLVVTAGKAQWNVNNVSYLPPKTPTLLKILEGANVAADFNITENTFILPKNAIIQVDFPPNDDDEAHPFHLHGNNFWLIKSNSSSLVNTVNPIRRDVAGVGAAGTTVRFQTNRPGPWFFHCHIFWHMQAGLATVMVSSPDTIRQTVRPDRAWDALCPQYNALPADLQYPLPREITTDEVKEYVKLYAQAAKNGVELAGFDGIEIHGGNGYLVDQFLQKGSNNRSDEYGGSIAARSKFGLDIIDAVAEAIGTKGTAIRLSPWCPWQDMCLEDPTAQFSHFVSTLKHRHPDLTFLHLIEARILGNTDRDTGPSESINFLRAIWKPSTLVVAGGYTRETAIRNVEEHNNELVAFG
ncbi:hypothetical protein DXG01_000715 [Tephrocybe rancida]|nr:hypothetical protein DXG01_000715 [Tephrocybe rancida]